MPYRTPLRSCGRKMKLNPMQRPAINWCMLRNTCIDRLRTNHSVPLESAEADFEGGYETSTEDMELYERLIVKGLTDSQMRIYNLITHDCLEYEEVARKLNMSVEAVRMNMSRARKRIRENVKMIDR